VLLARLKQQGRRFPLFIFERLTSTRRLRVSGFLVALTQRTHSQRAIGVMSFHRSWIPYAAAISTDGEAKMIAALPDTSDEHPPSADVIESCVAALMSQRDHIRAGAVVADVRLPELDSDAIRVDREHVEGHALIVLLPYKKKRLRKNVDYGQIRAEPGRQQIWT
jgi:hypothetical protein